MPSRDKTRLVLVGGGHTHVEVLKRWGAPPGRQVKLVLISDREKSVYSGMVPGLIAGRYPPEALGIALRPLVRRAGGELMVDRVVGIDPQAKLVELRGGGRVPYDVASLDVGGSVRGLDLPGVRETAMRTRPVHRLVDQLTELDRKLDAHRNAFRIVVVGGGAAGVELVFALHARCVRRNVAAKIELLESGAKLLPSFPEKARRVVEREFRARGIAWQTSLRVRGAERGACVCEGDSQLHPFDVLVWAAGASGQGFLGRSGLPTDAQGFVSTRATLQITEHDDLFASGDCAHLVATPWVPKSGVYAVRQGPLLHRNLQAQISGQRLATFRPQRDALALLNMADGRALASKWGMTRASRGMMRLKDAIDRRFMRRYQSAR
jgi:selenide,water dikinase